MKNRAFTLAEMLICIVVMGLLAVATISNMKFQNFNDKKYVASAYKVVQEFQQASMEIISNDKESCPVGKFMADNEFQLVNSSGSSPSLTEIMEIFAKHMKIEKIGSSFCDNTTYCTKISKASNKITGARLPGEIYVGIEKYDKISDCPSYIDLNKKETITPAKDFNNNTIKCWGQLYVDADGSKGPNALGEDVYIFGLGENGLIY